ncbi:MAG TPA: phosphoribosylanthranilate isomerase [Lacipirellulaceae bacterium]|nr:phosphoribosylanthranilate isomerase [Lacipirellulaceae bacterium]
MFQIKICGITNVDDAHAAIDAGTDALGFNFYRSSKRFIDHQAARRIADQLPTSVAKVGVFVDHPLEEILEAAARLRLDYIQLHGNEPPRFLTGLPRSLPILLAHRFGSNGFAPLSSYLDECRALGRMPVAVLLDSDVSGSLGGSGHTIDWPKVSAVRSIVRDISLILAGGLTATNVGQAVATVRPDAVDVASGVECEPGRKDAALVRQFVAAARNALKEL